MALSPSNAQPPDPYQIDRLSHLPDELLLTILSLLPTRIAARTSLLSRRFRHLWEASPSLDLSIGEIPYLKDETFFAMADRVIHRRNSSSHPLLRFRLYIADRPPFCVSLLSPLLEKVCSFSLRHLAIEGIGKLRNGTPGLAHIFSMTSLESLSIGIISLRSSLQKDSVLPSAINLTRLKTLSLGLSYVDPDQLRRLISEPCSLEELHLNVTSMEKLSISSNTIRKLKLIIEPDYRVLNVVELCLSSLDLLYVEHKGSQQLPQFLGKISNLKKAVLTLDRVHTGHCSRVAGFMDYISNVEELILHMKEAEWEKKPFPILLEPRKEAPHFSNMKHLEVTTCFHMHNFEAIVSILHQSPALESVKLVHELPEFTLDNGRQKKDWKSKLPRNEDRNYRYAYFRNLHLGENRLDFMKAMSKKCTSKSQERDKDLVFLSN